MVIWIIGLSGSGKTTLAKEVVDLVSRDGKAVVLLDGDSLREVFGNDLGFSVQDRRRNAERIMRLCLLLESQKINVICSILSAFPESRKWCRSNFKEYYEVFIDVPISELRKRDPKGIYKRFEDGKISNVVGLDIFFEKPTSPDLTIKNTHSIEFLLSYSEKIANVCRDN